MNNKMVMPEIGGWDDELIKDVIASAWRRMAKANNSNLKWKWMIGGAFKTSLDLGKEVAMIGKWFEFSPEGLCNDDSENTRVPLSYRLCRARSWCNFQHFHTCDFNSPVQTYMPEFE